MDFTVDITAATVAASCEAPITTPVLPNQEYEVGDPEKSIFVPAFIYSGSCTVTFTYTGALSSGGSLPSFIKFSSDPAIFTVSTSNHGNAGTYVLRVTGTCSSGQDPLSFTFKVQIKSSNTAPYFEEELTEELQVDVGQTKTLALPAIKDDQDDTVTTTMDVGSATFITLSDTVITVKPTEEAHLGSSPVTITLTDSKGTSKQYSVSIFVYPDESASESTTESSSSSSGASASSSSAASKTSTKKSKKEEEEEDDPPGTFSF